MKEIPKETLIAGICFIYTLDSMNVALSWTDIAVLVQLMIQGKNDGITRDDLLKIIPRHETRISGSLARLQQLQLADWNGKRGRAKVWHLTTDGLGLTSAIWHKYQVKLQAIKEIM